MKINNELKNILLNISASGGVGLLVGGSVRDWLTDPAITPKDLDVEVYGMDIENLIKILETYGKVDVVGKSFGVIKVTTEQTDYDFSLPRRENKSGQGHKGFIVEPDPTMTTREAAARRDFTFNSLAFNPLTGELIDHFDGQGDLKNGVMSATSEAFSEDPLRVLRGFQFAGRYGFHADTRTLDMCQRLIPEYHSLALERVWSEWYKWATKSTKPSAGLEFLKQSGWVELYPQLSALVGVPQDAEWHPEGDVWVHTLHVVDAAADICVREGLKGEDRAAIIFGALCHDLGKAIHTQFVDGRVRSRGHEQGGEEPTVAFLNSIGAPASLIARVIPLVTRHLAHITCDSAKSIRRLARDIAPCTIQELCYVIEADHSGRPPLAPGLPEGAKKLLAESQELNIAQRQPTALLGGKDLIALGLKPGKQFGQIIAQAFEAQLDGLFADKEGAIAWVKGVI